MSDLSVNPFSALFSNVGEAEQFILSTTKQGNLQQDQLQQDQISELEAVAGQFILMQLKVEYIEISHQYQSLKKEEHLILLQNWYIRLNGQIS